MSTHYIEIGNTFYMDNPLIWDPGYSPEFLSVVVQTDLYQGSKIPPIKHQILSRLSLVTIG